MHDRGQQLGILHGDCNQHNFTVGYDGKVTLVDFEDSMEGAGEVELEAEMANLEGQLRGKTGHGVRMVYRRCPTLYPPVRRQR